MAGVVERGRIARCELHRDCSPVLADPPRRRGSGSGLSTLVERARGLPGRRVRPRRDREDHGGSGHSGGTGGRPRWTDTAARSRCLACHGSAGDRRLLYKIGTREPEMIIESKDLDILRETTSKALLAVLWLHVPICVTIGMMRGTDWLFPG